MAGLLVNQGQALFLQAAVNKTAPQTLVLKLYQNNYTPVAGSLEGDFTEATFTGYAAASMTPANWVTSGGSPTTAAYPEVTFTSSADQATQNIYGYYIVQTTSGKVVAAERFSDAPLPITNNGDFIAVTSSISMTSP